MGFVYLPAFIALLVALAFTCEFTASVFTFVVTIAVVAWTVFPIEANMTGAASLVGATF